jgi:hypothetical protein
MARYMGFEVPIGLIHHLPDAIEIRQAIGKSGDFLRADCGTAEQQA